jgi:hypothetical protein
VPAAKGRMAATRATGLGTHLGRRGRVERLVRTAILFSKTRQNLTRPCGARAERQFRRFAKRMLAVASSLRVSLLSRLVPCRPARHVLARLPRRVLRRLRRVHPSRVRELPEGALLLARLRGRGVGRPPRRLRRV